MSIRPGIQRWSISKVTMEDRSKEFLQRLLFQIDRGHRHYQDYLRNKEYIFALSLFRVNLAISEDLEKNIGLLPVGMTAILLDWQVHLDTWFNQFQYLEKSLNPGLATPFSFDRHPGSTPFPSGIREEIVNLLEI